MNESDFVLGGQILAGAMASQIFLSKEYTEDNFQIQKLIKRIICAGYAFGLYYMSLGLKIFGDEWWITGLMVFLGMLAFGAVLEMLKKVPFAPKE